jgi:acetate kinase
MTNQMVLSRLLTINTGSSSLKAALFDLTHEGPPDLEAVVERIGSSGSRLRMTADRERPATDAPVDAQNHRAALDQLLAQLLTHSSARFLASPPEAVAPHRRPAVMQITAVGHRIVHGGRRYREAQRITPALRHDLAALVDIDPHHLPQALDGIDAVARACPSVPQVACFDTAFHRTIPAVARLYALPRRFREAGVERYGFHGLSCEYIMHELRAIDPPAAGGRIIIAHLGSGASMTAVHRGASVETTMGFSPAGGLVMGRRIGDVDPAVLLHAWRQPGSTVQAADELINHEAGLLAISETSDDMRDLLEREGSDARAAEAVGLFCHSAKKFLGGLMAVLGGLETLVFTAGIGEHAPSVRQRICAGLEPLGVELDRAANEANAPIISRAGGRTTVRVMKTDEDRMIAAHVREVLAASASPEAASPASASPPDRSVHDA